MKLKMKLLLILILLSAAVLSAAARPSVLWLADGRAIVVGCTSGELPQTTTYRDGTLLVQC